MLLAFLDTFGGGCAVQGMLTIGLVCGLFTPSTTFGLRRGIKLVESGKWIVELRSNSASLLVPSLLVPLSPSSPPTPSTIET
jgi:hypothetical protein